MFLACCCCRPISGSSRPIRRPLTVFDLPASLDLQHLSDFLHVEGFFPMMFFSRVLLRPGLWCPSSPASWCHCSAPTLQMPPPPPSRCSSEPWPQRPAPSGTSPPIMRLDGGFLRLMSLPVCRRPPAPPIPPGDDRGIHQSPV